MTITAFVFVGGAGPSPLEQWVHGARLAATADLLTHLRALPEVGEIVIAAAAPELAEAHPAWPVRWEVDPPGQPFHFGARLAALTTAYPAPAHAYFGAGCAPLLSAAALAEVMREVAQAGQPAAVTNNPLSSDWLVFNCAAELARRIPRLGRDNMLGPVLRYEAEVPVRGLPAAAATRCDLDTPADLLALTAAAGAGGIHLGPALAAYLAARPAPPAALARWRTAWEVLRTPGGRVTLIGRVSAAVWGQLEKRTRCWTRVLSEERGMTASGRQAAGAVRSLVADHLQQAGPEQFCATLAALGEAVFFDTRVALASQGRWPPAADRYASDALAPETITDPFLRALTTAAAAAPSPILLGGHGVVAGDLYVLLEGLAAER